MSSWEKLGVGVFVSIVVFILFIIVVAFTGLHVSTGKGTQVGHVSAVEKSGTFWKTGTAYIKPTLESTQEDIYCVMSDEVFTQLEEKSISGEKVKVSHNSFFSAGVTNCNGEDAIINNVEVIK